MAYTPYNYGGYPTPNYYAPPMPDQLAQLRQNQYNPMMQQQPMQVTPSTPPVQTTSPTVPASNGILWVQGEEGAKAWMVAPGSTVMLMDSDGSSFYLKSADASGMPQPLRIFDYKERSAAQKSPVDAQNFAQVDYVTREEWNALAARADALAKELAELKERKATTVQKKAVKDDENA